jgi:hypothetical protein
VLTAAFVLTDAELQSIIFAGTKEMLAYQMGAVQSNPAVLDHDLRRAEWDTGIPFPLLKEAFAVLFSHGPNAAAVTLMAAGYDPGKLEDWIDKQAAAERGPA